MHYQVMIKHPDVPFREDPSSCLEVDVVVSDLMGVDLLKARGDRMMQWLRAIIVQMWSVCVVHLDWR